MCIINIRFNSFIGHFLQQQRLHYLDVTRGFAILLMVIYHLSFDLDNFNFIQVDMDNDIAWISFRAVIVTLFLTTMGMSLAMTHANGICWSCMRKRSLFLGGASLLVSIGSYMQFPQSWIYFGILHFILFASWAGLLFLNKPWLSLMTAIGIIVSFYFGWLNTSAIFDVIQPLFNLPIAYTEDLVNIFPWLSPVLIGIFIVAKGWHVLPCLNESFISKKFSFLGRHSLVIYLIHQPILFGTTLLAYKLL